jgi:AraC-like DNA-binding protein
MSPPKRRVHRADTMPNTNQRTSDHVQFAGTRVLVRELPAVGELDVPGGFDHFCFCYWPCSREPDGMRFRRTDHERDNGSPLVIAPGRPFQCEWKKMDTVVANFQLVPAFLEEIAVSLRIDPRRLYESAVRTVTLDEPLESLCRLLMHEVAEGCQNGSAFFESISRALAVSLVRRLVPTRPPLPKDPRIERAVRFIEQHFPEKLSLKEMAEVAGLSTYHFLRVFTSSIGVSPHEYLIRCRLRYAQQLILSSARSRLLADIAVEAGFYDEAHLSWHFRRVFGQPPVRWLRQQ